MSCIHRGAGAGCCGTLYRCLSQDVRARLCTPSVESFAALLAERPGVDVADAGDQVHVCSECVRFTSPQTHQIGSRLAELISNVVGKVDCAACRWQCDELNQMAVEDIQRQRPAIVREIVSRAVQVAPRLWQRIVCRQLPTLAGFVASRLLTRAIAEEGGDDQ